MADEIFTHTFDVQLKGDGSQFIAGEIEFNVDGKISFKVNESSVPISKGALHHFIDLTDLLQKMFYECEGIKKIEITKKP